MSSSSSDENDEIEERLDDIIEDFIDEIYDDIVEAEPRKEPVAILNDTAKEDSTS